MRYAIVDQAGTVTDVVVWTPPDPDALKAAAQALRDGNAAGDGTGSSDAAAAILDAARNVWRPPEDHKAIPDPKGEAQIGGSWDGAAFVASAPITPVEEPPT